MDQLLHGPLVGVVTSEFDRFILSLSGNPDNSLLKIVHRERVLSYEGQIRDHVFNSLSKVITVGLSEDSSLLLYDEDLEFITTIQGIKCKFTLTLKIVDTDPFECLLDLMANCTTTLRQVHSDLETIKQENVFLKSDSIKVLELKDKVVTETTNLEKEMMAKFCLLLNEKKAKITSLVKENEDLKSTIESLEKPTVNLFEEDHVDSMVLSSQSKVPSRTKGRGIAALKRSALR
ncbi:hypothetical protein P9112_008657 [Eukaryota sp. TZLM1-RC]